MRAAAASLIAGLLAALQAGGAMFAADREAVKIGLLLSSDPAESASLKRGADLGAASAARMLGVPVLVVARGQHGQWGVEGNEAAALALDEAVDGMITPPGGAPAHQVLQVAGRTRLPVISLCPDSSVTSAGIPWSGRVAPQTSDDAAAIFAKMGVPSWAAVVPRERDGREARADLERAAATAGASIAEFAFFPAKPAEIRALCAKIAAARHEGVLLWLGPAAAGQMTAGLRTAGFNGVIAGWGRIAAADFFKHAGDAAKGVFAPALPIGDDFRGAGPEKHAGGPDLLAALAHDAVLCLAKLVAGGQPRVDASLAVPGGATGEIRFDGRGNRLVTPEMHVAGPDGFAAAGESILRSAVKKP